MTSGERSPRFTTSRVVMAAGVVVLFASGTVRPAHAAVPPVPSMSGPIAGPGLMYPTRRWASCRKRFRSKASRTSPRSISCRGPSTGFPTRRASSSGVRGTERFSGTVVSEALHAGGRSLIFEWSRVSILTRNHIFVEIVHSPANITLLKTFNAERYASLEHRAGPDQRRSSPRSARLIKSRTGPFAPYAVQRVTLMGTSASSGTVRTISAPTPSCGCPREVRSSTASC